MNIASYELCKELQELSGWEGIYDSQNSYEDDDGNRIPLYDLGYMLRKLPPVIQEDGKFLALQINFQGDGTFHMAYCEPYDKEFRGSYITNADVLENGVASLAIKLFKQGILKKQPEGGAR